MGDAPPTSTEDRQIPRLLKTRGGGTQLLVNGSPFLILGAELQNSAASCPEYMRSVWKKLVDSSVNTVLAPVTWEAIEPSETVFDFGKFDAFILNARRHNLHVILLWFGAFKNGMYSHTTTGASKLTASAKSTYAPSWVKTNPKRFPRAQSRKACGGVQLTDALSIFSEAVAGADAAAFSRLMQHLKEIDEEHSTVIMVQVENEVGLLGDSRDVCLSAAKCFAAPVPEVVTSALRSHWHTLHPRLRETLEVTSAAKCKSEGLSWAEAFGATPSTDALFMAYHFALYVERVAHAGKANYSLPMFTNVWQNYADEDADKSLPTVVGGGGKPGDYPSGGAVIDVLDIWQIFAPSLDFIAPDIYLNDYDSVCGKYRHRGQPLFIPEQRRDEYGARRIWSAYGNYGALCAAPFGIDTLKMSESVRHTNRQFFVVTG